jgi:hypothetical protein
VAKKIKRCLAKKCDREASVRGLCVPCYNALAREVKLGRTTWPKLVRLGIALESKQGGSGGNPAIAQLEAAEAEQAK